jgi:hypothetical protein
VVQGPALPVAVDPREDEEPGLARGQELLAGEFRRGVEVERHPAAVGLKRLRGKGVEVRLVAGRDLEGGRFDLDEVPVEEEAPQGRRDPVAADEEGTAVAVDVRIPPGGGG